MNRLYQLPGGKEFQITWEEIKQNGSGKPQINLTPTRDQRHLHVYLGLGGVQADVANREVLRSVAKYPYNQDSCRNVPTSCKKMATCGSGIKGGYDKDRQLIADSACRFHNTTKTLFAPRNIPPPAGAPNDLASGNRKTDALIGTSLTLGRFLWLERPPLPYPCSVAKIDPTQDQLEYLKFPSNVPKSDKISEVGEPLVAPEVNVLGSVPNSDKVSRQPK